MGVESVKATGARSREESTHRPPRVFVVVWVREAWVCVEVEELGSSMPKLSFFFDFRTSQALEQINLGELANSSIFLKQMERFLLLTKPSRITVDFLREVRKRLHKEPGSG